MRSEVLGLPVDVLSRVETINMIDGWLRQSVRKPRMVVTAYSEFYVKAQKDRVFAEIVRKADLVTPDGVSVLAGVRYNQRTQGIKNARTQGRVIKLMVEGLRVGGWGNVSLRTATLALERFPELRVSYDRGEDQVGTDRTTDDRVVKKINADKPDLLFVAYNPVKQEKWIASHLSQLKVGVVMGVGGTFNEYLGDFMQSPVWMERIGLKWLWRVMVEPKRAGRIFRAVVVFPWLVFVRSLRK
ncbi:MAG: Glycosyl transferase, WecB/TagA/CpsF family [Candidatus Collierbacteria bacterium GW2011_GWA1_45_15]|nr:MAG: Glycosyl transferase, WecB/TagA/CpsF family [Candidatus Collierbacteria bacterium GW2011_GWA1_45_15]